MVAAREVALTLPLSRGEREARAKPARSGDCSTAYYPSPIGPLEITATDKGISGISFSQESNNIFGVMPAQAGIQPTRKKASADVTALLQTCRSQLDDYFAGKRSAFDVPLDIHGTPFQQEVWQALAEIPYGETRTYQEIALRIGSPKAARAVGQACNRNPIGILIPCHRVLGTSGSLTGYAGGVEKKKALLSIEK